FTNKIKDTKSLKFLPISGVNLEKAKGVFKQTDDYALLYIPTIKTEKPEGIKLYAKKNISFELESDIEDLLEKELRNQQLQKQGISQEQLDKSKVSLKLSTQILGKEAGDEKSGNAGLTWAVGFGGAFLLYISLFIYGAQVMRGVMEEKVNRIVEVMVSSVKPFELMLGKIVGVGLVGLTQFVAWILLVILLVSGVSFIFGKEKAEQIAKARTEQSFKNTQTTPPATASFAQDPASFFQSLPIPLLIGGFLFYFLGGYLLYSALFAAVGSAVDVETDAQQFMFPITIPIIASFIAAQYVIREPDGAVAFWMSMIPFTSPIIMMVRLPFNPPVWELVLSMVLLVAGFIGTTWLAARIYRVGILMYGKKVSFKELYKWLFYRA
ncbi:MAG: ABC transporter permease, partial [Verrucomicrobia bacterium]|nr:ABC transporter permease [Cytophagales bacterium]